MAKKTQNAKPPVKIPLPFDAAFKGLLALSPKDAKDVRDEASKKKGS